VFVVIVCALDLQLIIVVVAVAAFFWTSSNSASKTPSLFPSPSLSFPFLPFFYFLSKLLGYSRRNAARSLK
jgi:hypothetical protein